MAILFWSLIDWIFGTRFAASMVLKKGRVTFIEVNIPFEKPIINESALPPATPISGTILPADNCVDTRDFVPIRLGRFEEE